MITIVTTVMGNSISYLEKFVFSLNVFLPKYDKQLIIYTDQPDNIRPTLSKVSCPSLKDVRMFDLPIPVIAVDRHKIAILKAASRYVKDNDYVFFIDVETLFIADANIDKLDLFLQEDWFIASLNDKYLGKNDRLGDVTEKFLGDLSGACQIDNVKDCLSKYYSSTFFGLRRDKIAELYMRYVILYEDDFHNAHIGDKFVNSTAEYLTKIYERTYAHYNTFCVPQNAMKKLEIQNLDNLRQAYPYMLAIQHY